MIGLDTNDPAFLGSLEGGAPPSGYDADAQNYISRVEAADANALEVAVQDAMNQLFLDLKSNDLWGQLTYVLPGAGPRTLDGGLVPLQDTDESGTFGTITWDRKTGFNNAADISAVTLPATLTEGTVGTQNDFSMAIWITQANGNNSFYAGGDQNEIRRIGTNQLTYRCRSLTANGAGNNTNAPGFTGISRNNSASYQRRRAGSTATVTQASASPTASTFRLFRSPAGRTGVQSANNTKVAWFHVGWNLNLATLEAIVADYRNAINAAI